MTNEYAKTALSYLSGFGNYFCSEAETGALPKDQNNPQKVPFGLFAEQLSASPFMSLRADNKHTWLYKIHPSVGNYTFKVKSHPQLQGRPFEKNASPNALRWLPFQLPKIKTDFVDGLITIAGNGDIDDMRGSAVYIYRANSSMENKVFSNNDAEMLFVPEMGAFKIFTELGEMELKPGEICVVPAAIKFKVELIDKQIRGYLLENYGSYLRLPELGPIGANGLASARHFLSPAAKYGKSENDVELIVKFQDKLWSTLLNHSPFDVVAWQGNYVPYKYDLSLFQVINTVSFDHLDPSIFTVLSSPSGVVGIPNVDFVIFPARWVVAEHTFRPPYFHRNCMNELMGLVSGEYESRTEKFLPGGITLHNRFTPHGPDVKTYERSISENLVPTRIDDNTLAIMFESSLIYQPTKQALNGDNLDTDYSALWQGFSSGFNK